MVLQRPFTFGDDSVKVELPLGPSHPTSLSTRGTLTPMSAALHLFELRRLQSDWYQTLHLCGSTPLDNPSTYLHTHTQKLAAWRDNIPPTLTPHTRDWLLLEWHYLNIYIAAPSPKTPHPTPQAMQQIYTHCTAYPIAFRSILKDQTSRFVYTYHDALRTYFVGSNLLHALYHAEDTLLPAHTPVKELENAADAIRAIVFVLSSMIIRWPEAEALRDKFRGGAGYVLERLRGRVEAIVVEEREVWRRQQMWELAAGGAWGWGGHVATPDFGNVAFYRYA